MYDWQVPAVLHREVLGLTSTTPDGEHYLLQPHVTVLLQWVNKRGEPFSRRDMVVSRQLVEVMKRIADSKQRDRDLAVMQELTLTLIRTLILTPP